jgi:nitric oxide reductase activation protein
MGLTLEHAFQNRKIKFDSLPGKTGAPYRDDNRYLWASENSDSIEPMNIPWQKLLSTNNTVSGTEEDKKRPSMQMRIDSAPASDTYVYSEWDYRSQINTPSWVTLRERKPKTGDLKIIEDITAQNKHLITRMKNLLLAIQYRGVRRIRKQEEGDEIDINAAIRAMIDIRLGIMPDDRIMMSSLRKTRDISVLVLLDLSGSANKKIHRQDNTVLQLTQKVCVLFADAIEAVGDPLAIHGFNSNSRHDVNYFRFKDFDQPYDDVPKAKIAGMAGDRSTRMGAAIRHATYYLNEHKSSKKLLMIITDGAPADIDMPDRHYLRYDLKHAVSEAQQSGIHTYCVGLDPKADEYVSRIFGARNYMVVDHVKYLPEKMLMIYAALTL